MSALVASRKRRGRNCTWLNPSRLASRVASSSVPLAMYDQCPACTLVRAVASRSNTVNASAGLSTTLMRSRVICAKPLCLMSWANPLSWTKAATPPNAATYGLAARNLRNSRRAPESGPRFMVAGCGLLRFRHERGEFGFAAHGHYAHLARAIDRHYDRELVALLEQ